MPPKVSSKGAKKAGKAKAVRTGDKKRKRKGTGECTSNCGGIAFFFRRQVSSGLVSTQQSEGEGRRGGSSSPRSRGSPFPLQLLFTPTRCATGHLTTGAVATHCTHPVWDDVRVTLPFFFRPYKCKGRSRDPNQTQGHHGV